MLQELKLVDFKSFASATVPFAPLTLLIGANASGKSNVFDALRFLQGTALDLTIAEVLRGRWEGGREIWPGIRGGSAEAARGGRHEFTLESAWALADCVVQHGLTCATGQHPHVTAEWLSSPDAGQYLFDTSAGSLGGGAGVQQGGGIAVALRRTGHGGRNVRDTLSSQRSLLGQIKPHDKTDPRVGDRASLLRTLLRALLFLDITPQRMRDYVPQSAQTLGAEGENLSAVVYAHSADEERKTELVDWLTELCAPELRDVGFVQTDLGDVMLQLVEADGTKISARSLSDGTLRFLGELVALLTAPEGSLLLVEEIENGLHPARAHLLVELLTQITRDRKIQVVATTHSPLVLEALASIAPDVLKQAVLLAREPGKEGTQARKLGDLPHFDELLGKRGIEHLFTTKWLERAL
jgi:hypothetical protein